MRLETARPGRRIGHQRHRLPSCREESGQGQWPGLTARTAAALTRPRRRSTSPSAVALIASGHGAAPRFDFIIVGGGSAGCALANRLSADPATRVLVLEAGRPDYRFDAFIHMPAALTFPIGSRFYDWRYESEPEPFMDGRRIYHARGKILGGSSSINGQIFQRGNPLDYERWAADPGHGDLGLRPLPAVLQEDGDLPRGRPGRPVARPRRPARSSSADRPTNPLFGAFFAACQEAGYHLTDDVNGYRQEGFAPFDRNIHDGRRLSAAQAYLKPVRGRAEPDRPDADVRDGRRVRGTAGGRASTSSGAVAERSGSRPARSSSRAARSTRRSCCSCRASGRRDGPGRARDPGRRGPAGRRREPPGPPRGLHPVQEPAAGLDAACRDGEVAPAVHRGRSGCSCGSGPGATNHFEGGGFARSNEDVAYPNLMFHFLPLAIRYDGSAGAAGPRLPGPRRADVLRRPRVGRARDRPTRATIPALRFNYLSTEQDRREWVEAIRVARHILNQPALEPYNGGETSPGPSVTTDDEILDWVARDAETALHPSCTARMGTDAGPCWTR